MLEFSRLLKKGNWGLIPAQHLTETVGLTKTYVMFCYSCDAVPHLWWPVTCHICYIPADFLVSIVIRNAKLAVCETDLNQKDMGFLEFFVGHY